MPSSSLRFRVYEINKDEEHKEIRRLVGQAWKEITDQEKQIFIEQANLDIIRYQNELLQFNVENEIAMNVEQSLQSVHEQTCQDNLYDDQISKKRVYHDVDSPFKKIKKEKCATVERVDVFDKQDVANNEVVSEFLMALEDLVEFVRTEDDHDRVFI